MKIHISSAILYFILIHSCFAGTVPDAPHIVITGEFEINTVPDILTISLSLSKVGVEVEEARNDVEHRARILITTLENIGISTKDINSAELQITPHYNWNKRSQIYVGTEVTRRISATLRDLSLYDRLIRSIIDAQVAQINNTELKSSREKELRDEATRGAITNGMAKARNMVDHLPETLGNIYSIAPASSNRPFLQTRYQPSSIAEKSAFAPGTIQFKEMLQIVFYLVKE